MNKNINIMIKRVYIMMLAVLAVSCTNNQLDAGDPEDPQSSGEIIYTVADQVADWTRGTSVDSGDDINDFIVYGVRKSGTDERSLYVNGLTAIEGQSGIWSFNPALYYPYGESLKFWAISPMTVESTATDDKGNGVTYSFDLEKEVSADGVSAATTRNELLTINYSVPTTDARNQPDIVVAAGQTGSTSPLELEYQHLLTKITLSAKLDDENVPATSTLITYDSEGNEIGTREVDNNDRYVVTRFTMQHIATNGTIMFEGGNIISTNDSGDWIIDQQIDRGVVIISTAYTLAPPTNEHAVELNTDDYQYIMKDSEGNDQALFMIPQRIEKLPADVYPYTPTVFVTVYDKELDAYYRTSELPLPTPDGDGWIMGEHINLQLEFNPSDDNLVIAMSITPVINEWTEHEVWAEVDPNITLWCSDNEIEAASGQVINLYTNTTNDPVVTFDDAGITATVGAKSGDSYFPVTIDASGATQTDVIMTVRVENSDSKTLTKQFALTVKQ